MNLETRNPASGELVEHFPAHDASIIADRIARAHDAAALWRKSPTAARVDLLVRLADLLEERAEEYGRLITSEMGKPISEAVAEVKKSALGARHFAEKGPEYLADAPIEGLNARVAYEPLGVIFAIMPWNLPFWQVLRFFIPTA
ncbi:MAG: aldehyde dehydrogenase family protein, partial [Pseudomonadota bacterium]